MAGMEAINLYETFKKIPNISHTQARAAADAVAYSTEAATKSDIANLRTELKTDMANLKTELKTDMANLKTELKTDMANLRTELKIDMADMKTYLTRWMVAMAGVVIAVMSVIMKL